MLTLAALVFPTTGGAQDLVNEALASFPPQTIRVEFSRPAALRKLPNYQSLRQRYVGPRLQAFESSLSQLGIREESVDALMLGGQAGKAEEDFYGYASGRFDAKAIADSAAGRGLSPSSVAGQQAYCLEAGLAGTCVTVLGNSLGAFGSLSSLTTMLEARAEGGPSLNAEERFVQLLGEAKKDAPIWGVALGPAVADWFKSWMPARGNVQMDWSSVFQGVESLVYSVEVAEKVRLNLLLDCATPEATTSLRQVLQGLKLAQQLAWQSQNPGRSNPFETMEIGLSGRRVVLNLATDYAQLEAAGAP